MRAIALTTFLLIYGTFLAAASCASAPAFGEPLTCDPVNEIPLADLDAGMLQNVPGVQRFKMMPRDLAAAVEAHLQTFPDSTIRPDAGYLYGIPDGGSAVVALVEGACVVAFIELKAAPPAQSM